MNLKTVHFHESHGVDTITLHRPESRTGRWILRETDEQIRQRAAAAYDGHQRCGIKGARRLLVSGW